MSLTRARPARSDVIAGARGRPRAPIILATLSVRIDPDGERMALETALELRSTLILANMLALRPYPVTSMLAPEFVTLPHEEDLDAVRASAARAAALGLRTELLRISTPRPIRALVELAQERRAALLVFAPEPARIRPRRLRAAARALRRDAPCHVWVSPGD